jgi:hypothetical protein
MLVFVSMISAGCYSYVPARMENIEPGQAVRLRLTPEEADRLNSVRMTDETVMDGIVVDRSNSELMVDTRVGTADPMRQTRMLHQRVNVPFGQIRDVELRERDKLKTVAAVGGVALVVGIGVAAALQGGSGGRPIDGNGPPEFHGYPLLRVPFSF